jgi:hypothetical protein
LSVTVTSSGGFKTAEFLSGSDTISFS